MNWLLYGGIAALAYFLITRGGGSAGAPAANRADNRPPGERVGVGDRFVADLTGFLGNQDHPEMNAPGQVFRAISVSGTGLPSPSSLSIQAVHEATGRMMMLGSAFVTQKL